MHVFHVKSKLESYFVEVLERIYKGYARVYAVCFLSLVGMENGFAQILNNLQ